MLFLAHSFVKACNICLKNVFDLALSTEVLIHTNILEVWF